jgi:hypothetical protein
MRETGAAAVLHDFDFSLELLDLLLGELLVVQHLDRHGIASASALHHDKTLTFLIYLSIYLFLFTYLLIYCLLRFYLFLFFHNGERGKEERARGGVVAVGLPCRRCRSCHERFHLPSCTRAQKLESACCPFPCEE